MPRDVNPSIETNERDFPWKITDCDDPEKAKLIKKLARMITDSLPAEFRESSRKTMWISGSWTVC